jgi:thiamine pyrophosphate-dependent acetolactate synthase large subunit-like protein
MFAPVTKAARLVADADQIAGAVLEAGSLALAASTGPVYLGVPTDLLPRRRRRGRRRSQSRRPHRRRHPSRRSIGRASCSRARPGR